MNLDPEIIKEIADELDIGMYCFLHIKTGEPLFIIDTEQPGASDVLEFYQEDLDKIEQNKDQYEKIEPMGSDEMFQVMEDFSKTVGSEEIRAKLQNALTQRKPFQNFRNLVDSYGDMRDNWFEFKEAKYIDWVKRRVKCLGE
ncbi:MAG: hypothetical protein JKY03_09255 [Aureispira sp.]|nr:hypothetical protein [Aureispira sp.]